jgi:creatinine amidohydrolase
MDDHLSSAVQMQYLRPRELEEAIRRFPVVYVPFGLIEWHGRHLPLGNDALKAHAILVKCAEHFGGVVYPPVYFSESLSKDLMQPLLTRLFFRLKGMGFRVILGVSGHNTFGQFNLIRDALAPVLASGGVAGDAQWEFESKMEAGTKAKYMPDGRLFINGQETTFQRDAESSSDHAAKWETSNMMCLYPELVDLRELGTEPFPLDMSPPWGIGGLDPRKHASAEVGRRNIELCAVAIGRRAKELLATLPEDQRAFSLPAICPPHWWSV